MALAPSRWGGRPAFAPGADQRAEGETLASKRMDEIAQTVWRDDIATPVTDPRLADILLHPRDAYTCPERIARHFTLSLDEKRLALCSWLLDLLADGRSGADIGSEVRAALAEFYVVDPGAAAVFQRAFAAQGLAPVLS